MVSQNSKFDTWQFLQITTVAECRERLEKVPNIRQNIHESIYDIVFNMDKITPPVALTSEESIKSAQYILSIGPEEPKEYTQVS